MTAEPYLLSGRKSDLIRGNGVVSLLIKMEQQIGVVLYTPVLKTYGRIHGGTPSENHQKRILHTAPSAAGKQPCGPKTPSAVRQTRAGLFPAAAVTISICSTLCAYITEHMDQPISLEQMARHVSLSPYHFSRLFKRETGYTPHQYLVIVRINAAKYYLKSTNLSIKQITQRCGFSSESNFCAVFKRFTGHTPGAYRDDDSEPLST